MSTRILSLANSPIYATASSLTNLVDAVTLIGNAAISEQLLVAGVSDAFGRKILDSPVGRSIWIHSLATGLTAAVMCRKIRMSGVDEAFSCALLHDIGKLILLRADAPWYSELLQSAEDGGDISEIERRTLGFDHAELGGEAAKNWKLPDRVCQMIRYHHEPEHVSDGYAMLRVIQTADAFVKNQISFEDPDLFFGDSRLQRFGMGEEEFEDIWDEVTLKMSAMTEPV
jgi:putative nucleotidyltransferase with HDIG domain